MSALHRHARPAGTGRIARIIWSAISRRPVYTWLHRGEVVEFAVLVGVAGAIGAQIALRILS